MEYKLYTLKEIADIFSVTEQTVRNWEAAGLITFLRLGKANLIRITQEELDRFITTKPVRG